ncbi:MAG: ABC transporter substrate-binding protein [Planctomycetota bacterium]
MSGCQSSQPTTDAEPIAIGAVFNATGAQAGLDVPSSRGATLATQQINAKGGVLGRRLAQIEVVGDSRPVAWTDAMASCLAEHPSVVAFLGLSDTDNVRAAGTEAARAGRVFLTSGATSPKLPAEFPGTVFLACFGDNVQAAAGAQWAYHTRGARKVHVYADLDRTYPRLLQGYFIDAFQALGGIVTGMQPVKPRATTVELTPPPAGVDLVYVSVETGNDPVRVIDALRQAGYDGPVLGGDGYDDPAAWRDSPLADVYFTTHVYLGGDHPDPRVADFVTEYHAAFDEAPTAFAALGYDAVGLMAKALDNAGVADPGKVAEGLSRIENYPGVTGDISYTDGSQIPLKSVTLVRIDAGRFAFVDEVKPTRVPPP